jgi:hypothetical protein
VSGGGQSAAPGATLEPIVVRVSDATGNGVVGQTVSFVVTSGGGSVTPSSGISNPEGLVTTSWTLGPAQGAQTMTAASAGFTPNPLTITATAAPTPSVGTVRVTAPTTGTDIPDWYSVHVDGRWAGDLTAGATLSVVVGEGSHAIQLYGVAPNCTVAGPNPAQATVTRGVTTNVVFPVSCVPNPTLRVTVTTTGSNLPSGYTVGVDWDYWYYYYVYSFAAPANGAASIRIPPGSHVVWLDGVASNCTVSTANPVSVAMSLGATVDVAFTVTCR